ncbi:DNA-binding response regulator [Arachidicoccus ginsenosidimutans]|uniref:LytR/AlgR family response regulator transcription factor n=1 Tax=Arachidicoccus sp. BS20 TaxID=1850526 RepID=UPI0007F0DF13|nr:LytTR family DNA-binding domain-containing protein [Arachidicoccus sp. BS20]ANI89964.1 DNA-binding response regulator [Arachidicoccus sp. BS20]
MIKAVILDDEPRGSRLMEQKLKLFSDEIIIEAVYNLPQTALAEITKVQPDVLFLDVEMPVLNGFQFLERLSEFDFEIIFTTAYNSYILDALRISAVDYLLKPIEEDELRDAIRRLKKRMATKANMPKTPAKTKSISKNKIALPTAEGIHLIEKSQITRIEALSNYSTFILTDKKKIIVSRTLKEYENMLSSDNFMRVNRSVIVNLEFVLKYKRGDGGVLELMDGSEIDVSPNKKEELLAKIF